MNIRIGDCIELSSNEANPLGLMDFGSVDDIGIGSNPIVQIREQPAAAVDLSSHPWEVTLSENDAGAWVAAMNVGKIYDKLLSVTEYDDDLEWDDEVVVAGNIIYVEYFYDDGGDFLLLGLATDDTEFDPPFDVVDENAYPLVPTSVRYPLAKIIADPSDDAPIGAVIVEQMARNNLALTSICYDGTVVKYFNSI